MGARGRRHTPCRQWMGRRESITLGRESQSRRTMLPRPWAEPSPAPEPVIYPSWSAEAEQGKTDEESDRQRGAGYSLYCGFEEWDFSSSYDEPFELSPFPLPFSSSSSRSSRSSLYSKKTRRRSFHKSTGCGGTHTHETGRPERGSRDVACQRESVGVRRLAR